MSNACSDPPVVVRPGLKYRYFAANLTVLWLALLFYRNNHYYVGFLSAQTQRLLLWMGLAYTLGGLIYYWLAKEPEPTHGYRALCGLSRWLMSACRHLRALGQGSRLPIEGFSKPELLSVLFLVLKLVYLPMMFEFMVANWHELAVLWWSYSGVLRMPRVEAFNGFFFPFLIDVMFILECALYAFGYAVESPFCRNVVKSVDSTFLGWAVALACYPPFNGLVNNWAPWYTSDEPEFANPNATAVLRGVVLVLFVIYTIGAISLGTKCSNLTNRGIVTTGAFAYVRHPAYAAKNLAWWLGILPVLSVPAVLSMALWSLIYFLRAVTEERHLMNDSAYQAYCKKVQYRFIPGLF